MLLTRKISNFICVSNGVQEDLLQKYWGISADQVTSIPNGIDYKPFEIEVSKSHARETISAHLEGKFLIGTVGRLAPKKNQKRLIEAFSMALKENPGMCLIIAGTGPLINSLTQTVTNSNLKKNVIFTGFRSDIPILLRALDAFILPSLPGEGLPLALLEAMGSGLPVIASKIPGVIEIFNGTNMGYLVDPLNTKQMAEEILHISRLSGSELSDMGLNAKKRAFSDYNSGLMVKKISSLYETVAP
jgi:glycosyltransferase involved in cell wall biosynthesis